MPGQEPDKRQAAREVIDVLHEIATLLVFPETPFGRYRKQAYHELVEHTFESAAAIVLCLAR